MFSELEDFVSEYLGTIELTALGVVVLGLLLLWWQLRRRNPLARRIGRWSMWRWLKNEMDRLPEPAAEDLPNQQQRRHAVARMTRYQVLHDKFSDPKTVANLKKNAKHGEQLKRQAMTYMVDFAPLPKLQHQRLDASTRVANVAVPLGWPPAKIGLNLALLAGDILLVSNALALVDTQLTVELSWVFAAAIASTIWLLGKVIGESLILNSRASFRRSIIGTGAAALLVAAAGLSLLRQTEELTVEGRFVMWALLSLLPGIGSAAVALLSSSEEHMKYRDASRRYSLQRLRIWWRAHLMARQAAKFQSTAVQGRLDLLTAHLEEAAVEAEFGPTPAAGAAAGDAGLEIDLRKTIHASHQEYRLLGTGAADDGDTSPSRVEPSDSCYAETVKSMAEAARLIDLDAAAPMTETDGRDLNGSSPGEAKVTERASRSTDRDRGEGA